MLDIYIAESYDAATRNDPVCGFDIKVHELIFSRDNVPIEQYPLLWRMRDFFADTSFKASELPQLAQEIQSLSSVVPPTNAVASTLEQLHKACESAILMQQDLYVMCD